MLDLLHGESDRRFLEPGLLHYLDDGQNRVVPILKLALSQGCDGNIAVAIEGRTLHFREYTLAAWLCCLRQVDQVARDAAFLVAGLAHAVNLLAAEHV